MAKTKRKLAPITELDEFIGEQHRARIQARAGAKLAIPRGFSYTTPKPYCDKSQMEKGRCGVQLIFRDGIPNLRFCTKRKEPGALVPLATRSGDQITRTVSPQAASELASKVCACWERHKSYERCIPAKYRKKGKLMTGRVDPTSKGWKKQTLKRTTKRRKQMKRFGKECYLEPGTGKPGSRPKYPVCTKRGDMSCKGLAAAFNRARMQRNAKVKRKALRLAKKHGCGWAQDY